MKLEQPVASYGSPQKEDGYTPFANELLEAILKADFSKRQLLVIMTIARMTYGFSRKVDALSSVQIANLTGINRPKVSETLRELVDMNVVTKLDSGRISHGHFVNEIALNKYYKTWNLTDTNLIPDNRYQNDTDTKTVTDTNVVSLTDTKTGIRQIPKRDTHKAIKTIKTNMRKKTSIPDDFCISERVKKWALEKQVKHIEKHFDNFVLTCQSKGYEYLNWDSAFMKAINSNWAKVESEPVKPKEKFL